MGVSRAGHCEDDGSPGRARWIEGLTRVRASIDHWGEGYTADWAVPSLSHNLRYRQAVGMLERASMSPKMALLTWQAHLRQMNVRDILSSVHVPTLVLHP